MAYVLGYLYADGSVEDASYIRARYLRVTSTDKDRIELIRFLLQSEHTIVKEKPPGNRKYRFLLRIGNRKLFDSLLARGLTPRKSLTMTLPDVPDLFFPHFLRGYFDGDGCVFLEEKRQDDRPAAIKRLSIIFTSGSEDFLLALQRRIASFVKIRGHLYQATRAKQLHYFTQESLMLFQLMYSNTKEPLYMRRKYDIFDEYFTRRPHKITPEIRRILKAQQGSVVKG